MQSITDVSIFKNLIFGGETAYAIVRDAEGQIGMILMIEEREMLPMILDDPEALQRYAALKSTAPPPEESEGGAPS